MVVLLVGCLHSAAAHMFMVKPRVRGLLWGSNMIELPAYDPTAPRDYLPHFPAGSRLEEPGAGLQSQIEAAGSKGWTPFEPEKRDFVWRAGVCGDLKTDNDHMRGGRYYHNGMVTRVYPEGGVLDVDLAIVEHHNGFLELRLCNAVKCGGEISEKCFRRGHCVQLNRTRERSCETRVDPHCAPKDPVYPGRWHFPCSKQQPDRFGAGKIRYRLPRGWSGRHMVLHMYHVVANSCMPPGVTDFFKGPRGPRWGECEGQGGAIGGYRRWPQLCGGKRFAEEYYQCADIGIKPRRRRKPIARRRPPPKGRRRPRHRLPPRGRRSPGRRTHLPVKRRHPLRRRVPPRRTVPARRRGPKGRLPPPRMPPRGRRHPGQYKSPMRPLPKTPVRRGPPRGTAKPRRRPSPARLRTRTPPSTRRPAPVRWARTRRGAPPARTGPVPRSYTPTARTPPRRTIPTRHPATLRSSTGPLSKFVFVADGARLKRFGDGARVTIDVSAYRQITFEVLTTGRPSKVTFTVDGGWRWVERKPPYMFKGDFDWGYGYWSSPIIGRPFEIRVAAGGHEMKATVTLVKRS